MLHWVNSQTARARAGAWAPVPVVDTNIKVEVVRAQSSNHGCKDERFLSVLPSETGGRVVTFLILHCLCLHQLGELYINGVPAQDSG